MCIYSSLFWKHHPPFLWRALNFCLAIHCDGLVWRFYSCERTDKYSPRTSRLGETFPHMPFAAILLLTPSGTIKRPNHPFVFGTRIGNPSHHSKIFSFRRALWTVNCSTGVKWCLAPDCCCSHCHVCRLHCCSRRHPSSKRHWKRGKQSERCFMILLGQRKHCWEGVGAFTLLYLSECPYRSACLFTSHLVACKCVYFFIIPC